MLAQPQSSRTFVYVTVYPDDYDETQAYPLVIFLHGYGAHMYDLTTLAPSIDRHGYIYVFPNAPIPVLIGQGMVGYSWRPPRDDGSDIAIQQEKASFIENQLWDYFAEVQERYSTPPGQTLLAGFSQGGTMTYNLGLPRPDLFAGIAALSTGLPAASAGDNPSGLTLPEDRSQPIFIAHGLRDDMIAPDRARQSKLFLEENGYQPEYHEYDIGHEISQEVLGDLAVWARSILPPLAS